MLFDWKCSKCADLLWKFKWQPTGNVNEIHLHVFGTYNSLPSPLLIEAKIIVLRCIDRENGTNFPKHVNSCQLSLTHLHKANRLIQWCYLIHIFQGFHSISIQYSNQNNKKRLHEEERNPHKTKVNINQFIMCLIFFVAGNFYKMLWRAFFVPPSHCKQGEIPIQSVTFKQCRSFK